MPEIETRFIRRGFWVNHAQGPVLGQTVTVDTSASVIIIAFLAILASFALGHLFNIFTFTAYHIRNRIYERQPDGLFRQQQVLLRTLPTPSSLAADVFKLWYSWRYVSKISFSRSALLLFLPLVYAVGMTVAGVFTSSVVSSTNIEVLVNSPYCTGVGENLLNSTFQDRVEETNIESFSYADDCYMNESSFSSRCKIFTAPRIPFSTTVGKCPFPKMGCNSPALTFDSNLLDVSDNFGFNLANNHRVLYRKRARCAIVPSSNYVRRVPASEVPSYLRLRPYYQYEEFLLYAMGSRISLPGNITFLQSLGDLNTSYKFEIKEARRWLSGIESYFTPLPEMTNDSADTLLRIVNKNSVYYSQPVDDIMFSAHQAAVAWETSEATNRTWYMSDTLSTTIGCLEQYQYCALVNSTKTLCSELTGLPGNVSELGFLGASGLQLEVLNALIIIGRIHSTMSTQKLRVSDFQGASGGEISTPIPDNQWSIEFTGWQNHAWAAHQIAVAGFATGIKRLAPTAEYARKPVATQPKSQLCNIIKMRKTGDVANINVFAIIFIVIVSSVIVALDILLLRDLIFLDSLKKTLSPIIDRWIQEDVYHLQRRAYEALNEGEWINTNKEIPITRDNTILSDLSVKRYTMEVKIRNKYYKELNMRRSKTW